MMRAIFLLVSCIAGISHAQDQLACFNGPRSTNSSGIFDLWGVSICEATEQQCRSDVYQFEDGAYWEFGSCFTPTDPASTCQERADDLNVNGFEDCTENFCDSVICNKWITPPGCTEPPSGDFQILPACTLKEALSVDQCLHSYIAGLPYTDGTKTCKANINTALSCGYEKVIKCLGSHCPNILDALAINIAYPSVTQFAARDLDINDLVDLLHPPYVSATIKNQFIDAICLQNSVLPEVIDSLSYAWNQSLSFGKPVCLDDDILSDLLEWTMTALNEITAASTHEAICAIISAGMANVTNAWQTRCSMSNVVELIKNSPQPWASLLSDIEPALGIVENHLLAFQFPGCSDAFTEIMTTSSTDGGAKRTFSLLYFGLISAASALVY